MTGLQSPRGRRRGCGRSRVLACGSFATRLILSIVPALASSSPTGPIGSEARASLTSGLPAPVVEPDWAYLPAALFQLEASNIASLTAVTYDVRMAAAAAHCRNAAAPVSDLMTNDDDVRSVYSRLACTPEPAKVAHHLWSRKLLATSLRLASPFREPSVTTPVQAAIERGAEISGVAPEYLWRTAAAESGFRPEAAASSSSARGLYQFIESTWLSAVRKYGRGLGLDRAAMTVQMDRRGRPLVPDPIAKADILALRSDPLIAATIAGMLTRENASRLAARGFKAASSEELYAAHVLGPEGAAILFQTVHTKPQLPAASIFPAEAKANPRLFYRTAGPTSIADLVEELSLRTGV